MVVIWLRARLSGVPFAVTCSWATTGQGRPSPHQQQVLYPPKQNAQSGSRRVFFFIQYLFSSRQSPNPSGLTAMHCRNWQQKSGMKESTNFHNNVEGSMTSIWSDKQTGKEQARTSKLFPLVWIHVRIRCEIKTESVGKKNWAHNVILII